VAGKRTAPAGRTRGARENGALRKPAIDPMASRKSAGTEGAAGRSAGVAPAPPAFLPLPLFRLPISDFVVEKISKKNKKKSRDEFLLGDFARHGFAVCCITPGVDRESDFWLRCKCHPNVRNHTFFFSSFFSFFFFFFLSGVGF
jgi:hypothetical protein